MSKRRSAPTRAPLAFTPPSLALAMPEPPLGSNWVHEIKFDGYRVQALVENGEVRLLTRNALDWTPRFGTVTKDIAALKARTAALDCEAVVLDEVGASDFSRLQAELKKGSAAHIHMMAFDLLHLDGRDLRGKPLLERKTALETLIGKAKPDHGLLRYSAHMTGDARKILQNACGMGLEGIISKRIDLPYRSGRNGDWTKSKCIMADPFVVVGYVPSKAGAGLVGSLVLAFHDGGQLVYAGRVGTGFSLAEAQAMAEGFETIRRKTPPLKQTLTREQLNGVVWVSPKLVAQVSYRDVTADGNMRHASFEHFREDKRSAEIKRPRAFLRS